MPSPERAQSSEKTTLVFRGTVTFVREVILPRSRPFHTVAFTPAPGADPYYVNVFNQKLLRGIAPGVVIEVELTKKDGNWLPTRITPQVEPPRRTRKTGDGKRQRGEEEPSG